MFFEIFNSRQLFVDLTVNGIDGSYSFLFNVIVFFGLIMAIAIHEFAHAWSAYLLGDDTAKMNDRLTINPIKHFDIFGFLLIFFTKFGYGKPVPVNPNNFKNPMFGNMAVALAGPLSNIIQAGLYAALFLALKQLASGENLLTTIIATLPTIGIINIALAVFNLLPIYPLDGSKIWGYFSPTVDDFIMRIAPYSFIILIAVIFPIFGNTSILNELLKPVITAYQFILRI